MSVSTNTPGYIARGFFTFFKVERAKPKDEAAPDKRTKSSKTKTKASAKAKVKVKATDWAFSVGLAIQGAPLLAIVSNRDTKFRFYRNEVQTDGIVKRLERDLGYALYQHNESRRDPATGSRFTATWWSAKPKGKATSKSGKRAPKHLVVELELGIVSVTPDTRGGKYSNRYRIDCDVLDTRVRPSGTNRVPKDLI